MYPKKRNRLRVLALLLSLVLALCVLTGAAIAEEPFPDTPEDPTTETVEQTPAEETPETEPGGEDVPPSEPEEPEEEDFSQKPEKKHYVGLKFAIALELLGIAALFWWWYLWIR